MRIGIVDSDAATRLLLRTLILQQDGPSAEVHEMSSAEQVLEQLEQGQQPDVYILDLGIQGMDGLQICRTLRDYSLGVSEFIPYIIATTLADSTETAAMAIEAGANDYLPKPVNLKVLQTRLRVACKLIEQARGQEEQARSQQEYVCAQSMVSLGIAYAAVPAAIIDIRCPDVFAYIVYANDALLNLIESDADAVLGHSLATFQSWHPEMIEGISACFAAGKPFVSRLVSESPYFSTLDKRVSGYPICSPGDEICQYLVLEEPMAAY